MPERHLHLAVALDGAGWHPPAASRYALARGGITHDHADRVRSHELLAGEWSQR